MTNPPLWKASVALTKLEAADVAAALELGADAQAVLIAEEPFADGAVAFTVEFSETGRGELPHAAKTQQKIANKIARIISAILA